MHQCSLHLVSQGTKKEKNTPKHFTRALLHHIPIKPHAHPRSPIFTIFSSPLIKDTVIPHFGKKLAMVADFGTPLPPPPRKKKARPLALGLSCRDLGVLARMSGEKYRCANTVAPSRQSLPLSWAGGDILT